VIREDVAPAITASAQAWAALGYLVVFGSLIGFTAFAYCLTVLPANTVSTYAYVNPVVAVALGALILREPVSAGLLGGAVLILFAVVLTSRARKAKPAPPPREARTELEDAA
jgi:drug/metabolite transporter (DMT)-like permease